MNAKELYNEWTEGETSGLRPARVIELRDELQEYTGMAIPHRRSQVEGFVDRMKPQITRKLKDAAEAMETDESSSDDSDDDSTE